MSSSSNERLFRLQGKELASYENFLKQHKECRVDDKTKMSKFGTVGGGTEIAFEPTGLGNIVRVKCLGCQTEEDITDYSSW